MEDLTVNQPRALLVAADLGEYDVEASLEELAELADTAGAQVIAKMSQKRSEFDSATCIGSGRLEEIAQFVKDQEVDLLIFDHELSASQLRNIEAACETAVIDRTMLILDIFAQRAKSSEGRLQVELAQQRYRLPRLSGLGTSLSRLGGGIGTRGPGETKLETDRRHIRRRIQTLESQLDEMEKRRKLLRRRRKKDGVLVVTIVGYTNVGKSTLLNALTDAGVLEEDKLFATLDPTSRGLDLPDGRRVMLIDTVGFISRLPHHLVEAFKSTLEEAVNADLILNLCDISNPQMEQQKKVTEQLLAELGIQDTPIITVLNKCDRVSGVDFFMGENSVAISAKTGFGFEALLQKIAQKLIETHRRLTLLIPYGQEGLLHEIRREGKVFQEEYTQDGCLADVLVDIKLLYKVSDYIQ